MDRTVNLSCFVTVLLLATSVICVGCRKDEPGVIGKQVVVSPESELGKQILALDAVGRAHQNAPRFSNSIQAFEAAHGERCTDTMFDELREPAEKITEDESIYVLLGLSPTCGKRAYRARIVFSDPARTIANRVEILARVDASDL